MTDRAQAQRRSRSLQQVLVEPHPGWVLNTRRHPRPNGKAESFNRLTDERVFAGDE